MRATTQEEYQAVCILTFCCLFFFSSRRRHTRCLSDWSSDVCSSDLPRVPPAGRDAAQGAGGAHHERGATAQAAGRRGAGAHRHAGGARQIGRASCRERGKSPGGGRPIKKEKVTQTRKGTHASDDAGRVSGGLHPDLLLLIFFFKQKTAYEMPK